MELQGVRVLAFGTAGNQGSGLVEALEKRGAIPVLASSRAEVVAKWRAAGREAVVSDLTDPDGVGAAATEARAKAAVLHLPVSVMASQRLAAFTRSVVRLAEGGLSVSVNFGRSTPPAGTPDPFNLRANAEEMTAAGATVFEVTAYLENHAAPWVLDLLARGELVYPRPGGYPFAWITARDVTAAAVAAIARDLRGRVMLLGGPEALTFSALAREIGAGLRRQVTFRRVTADEYGELLRPFLGDAAAAGIAEHYRSMPEEPEPLSTLDASATWAELGVMPTRARDWAEQVLAPLLDRHAAGGKGD